MLLGLCACHVEQYSARRTERFRLPAAGVRKLLCQTHNGDILVRAGTGSEIHGEVDLVARAWTQQDADAWLGKMALTTAVTAGELRLGWRWNGDAPTECQGDATYRIEIPAALAADLQTHNGGIDATGLAGAGRITTHNGSVELAGDLDQVDIDSHNGRVALRTTGTGAIAGSIRTHNGAISLDVGERAAHVFASTHSGRITCEHTGNARQQDGSRLEVKIREASAKLELTTHAGAIDVH